MRRRPNWISGAYYLLEDLLLRSRTTYLHIGEDTKEDIERQDDAIKTLKAVFIVLADFLFAGEVMAPSENLRPFAFATVGAVEAVKVSGVAAVRWLSKNLRAAQQIPG